ncbi:uncharacterized protein LOC117182436 [Belonocnema kinseyi]|uniref:uncharacterized protein LOC117182436 n=1 Tax=Belonocnema kinseyi TaxID=2817044 RepID=UPI00143D5986|nr:uncharacterized protein LOC117182436 [Belonocnema kinseyi]
MAPSTVNLQNAAVACANIQRQFVREAIRKKVPKYSVDDIARVSRAKDIFAKEYEAGWTEELFVIKKVITWKTHAPILYELRDSAEEDIDEIFYLQELADVKNKDVENDEFIVEKVIQTKGRGAKKQLLVKWVGYSDKLNSWIQATELNTIQ